jgi:hypothetical protein
MYRKIRDAAPVMMLTVDINLTNSREPHTGSTTRERRRIKTTLKISCANPGINLEISHQHKKSNATVASQDPHMTSTTLCNAEMNDLTLHIVTSIKPAVKIFQTQGINLQFNRRCKYTQLLSQDLAVHIPLQQTHLPGTKARYCLEVGAISCVRYPATKIPAMTLESLVKLRFRPPSDLVPGGTVMA